MSDTPQPSSPPLSGRRAQAARNDLRILEAARKVLLADPSAPVAAVAKEAGVGIAALYRRYPSKEALLYRLFLDRQHNDIAATRAALEDRGDPWTVFRRYVHGRLESGTGVLSLHFAVTFPITDELRAAAREVREVMTELVERTQAAGALRSDVGAADIGFLLTPAQAIDIGDPVRNSQIRHRYLSLELDGLRASATTPLPGPPPGWYEFGEVWEKVVPSPLPPGPFIDVGELVGETPDDPALIGRSDPSTGHPDRLDDPIAAVPIPLSGRRAEAARNDLRILTTARKIFMADANAPIAAIAEAAGVGIAAVYRRYPSKEALLQKLYLDGLRAVLAEVKQALADPGEPRDVFRRYAHRSLAVGTGSLSSRFAGAFPTTPEMDRLNQELSVLHQQLIRRLQGASALRPDVGLGDLQWLFFPLYAVRVDDGERTAQLRHRILAILVDGLLTPDPSPLLGPPPTGDEFNAYWNEQLAKSGKADPGPAAATRT